MNNVIAPWSFLELRKRRRTERGPAVSECSEGFVAGDGGVLVAQASEDPLPDVRVEGVELVGEFAPDGFGGAEQFVRA